MNEVVGDGRAGRPNSEPRMERRPRRTLAFGTAAAGAIILGFAFGFIAFAETVVRSTPPADPRAEGIVVLTGGAARIDGALQLLAEGRAQRLLISGVNPSVGLDTLAEIVDAQIKPALYCCVDVDNARDTIENASETQRWAEAQGFGSLIVVTSDYHMPRTIAELGGAMPEVELIPFPVSSPDLDLAGWWRDTTAFGLLAREYGKFLAAEARQFLPQTRRASAAGGP